MALNFESHSVSHAYWVKLFATKYHPSLFIVWFEGAFIHSTCQPSYIMHKSNIKDVKLKLNFIIFKYPFQSFLNIL